jgi:hypothetical protein
MRSMLLKGLRPAVFGKQWKPEKPKAVRITLAEVRERVEEAKRGREHEIIWVTFSARECIRIAQTKHKHRK